MKRADHLDVQCCRFFQQRLHLRAVFSYDIKIISSCFTRPWLFHIKRSEFSKSVRWKQDLFWLFICHHDFRPVHHRCHNELQCMSSEIQCISFFYNNRSAREIHIKELRHHSESLCISYNLHIRKFVDQCFCIRCMIRFHMGNHKIINRSSFQYSVKIFQPLFCSSLIHCIHQSNLFV